MNIPFTNQTLYPSAYYCVPVWFPSGPAFLHIPVSIYCNPGNAKTQPYPQQVSFEYMQKLVDRCKSIRIDDCLDAMLRSAGINRDYMHAVDLLDRPVVLELVKYYYDCYYLDHSCIVGYSFKGVYIDDLNDGQLRKLALWLYHQLQER